MSFSENYREKLVDPRWQKKRLQILSRDNWACRNCAASDKTLHVHHLHYRSIEPWEYDDFELVTLCEECHDREPEAWGEYLAWLEELMIRANETSTGILMIAMCVEAICARGISVSELICALHNEILGLRDNDRTVSLSIGEKLEEIPALSEAKTAVDKTPS